MNRAIRQWATQSVSSGAKLFTAVRGGGLFAFPVVPDGSGVTVGILSDSFNSATTYDHAGAIDNAATDIAAGLLPSELQILSDNPSGTDEGRAMAQIVHRTAPGAALLFETAAGGQAAYAKHILDLAAAGAQIIVDDVGYAAEPNYQNGIIAQAIDQVVAEGVTYISAAGNNGAAGYQGAFQAGGKFKSGGVSYTAQRFSNDAGPLGDTLLSLSGQMGQEAYIQLEWSQPSASVSLGQGATGDLDIFLTDARGNVVAKTKAQHDNVGGDPIEVLGVRFIDDGPYYLRVGLRDGTEAPDDIRITAISDGHPLSMGPASSAASMGTLIGHRGAPGDIAVGAARLIKASDDNVAHPVTEPFSSAGPTMRIYDDTGVLLPSPMLGGVAVSGLDGVSTSFFRTGKQVDSNGDPLFFGTSAAAPQVAAIAALLLQEDPALTPAQIRQVLEDTAAPTEDGSGLMNPDVGGAGLVQPDAALREVKRFETSKNRGDASPFMFSGMSPSDALVAALYDVPCSTPDNDLKIAHSFIGNDPAGAAVPCRHFLAAAFGRN